VDDFTKQVHIVEATPAGFGPLGDVVEVLASAEGLDAHAESIRVRRASNGYPS
jgi:histidinol dehydrogenase